MGDNQSITIYTITMKDITLNPLDKNQRKLLQWGVILMLCVFLIGYFFFISKKNSTVYLENQNLHVFDDSMIFEYPDRLSMHYPYLLLVQPEKQITEIYNLDQKTKEKDVNETALDYQNGQLLYVKGETTFIDKEDLSVLCEKGIIKNDHEVLCVTKLNPNSIQNKLISIDLKTKKRKDMYVSQNIITDLTIIQNSYYLGEIGIYDHKNNIVIDGKSMDAPNMVSVIYQMQGKPYFASFKSALNKGNAEFFEINGNQVVKQDDDKIVFYK